MKYLCLAALWEDLNYLVFLYVQVKKEQSDEEFEQREIIHLDIAYDPLSEKHEKTCPVCPSLYFYLLPFI